MKAPSYSAWARGNHIRRRLGGGLVLASLLFSTGCLSALPHVKVSSESALETAESGSSVKLSVALTQKPRGVVEVYAESSNPSEGMVSAPVRFDEANWRTAQHITVTGVDDTVRDGDVSYDVTLYARVLSMSDSEPELVEVLHFINRDDDVATFTQFGDLPGGQFASYATAVDASGNIAVGWSISAAGAEATRWTQREGLQSLGGHDSEAASISPNGKIIVGSVAEPSFEKGIAAASWTDGQPYRVLAPAPAPNTMNPLFWFVDATVARDDGSVYGTCLQYASYDEPIACMLRRTGELDNLPASYVYAVDDQDDWAGSVNAERHAPPNSRATYDGNVLDYVPGAACGPTSTCQAAARALTPSGSLLVGTSSIATAGSADSLHEQAFLFTREEGTLVLHDLTGGADASGAYAVSADGHLIAGFGTDAQGQQAVLWVDRQARALEQELRAQGGKLPEGWRMREVRAMSASGLVFVGNGTNAQGRPEAFRVSLVTVPQADLALN